MCLLLWAPHLKQNRSGEKKEHLLHCLQLAYLVATSPIGTCIARWCIDAICHARLKVFHEMVAKETQWKHLFFYEWQIHLFTSTLLFIFLALLRAWWANRGGVVRLCLVFAQLKNCSSSSSMFTSGTICSCSLSPLLCTAVPPSAPDEANHGCSRISREVRRSAGSRRRMERIRHLALGVSVSGMLKWPLRILLNSEPGSTSWKG